MKTGRPGLAKVRVGTHDVTIRARDEAQAEQTAKRLQAWDAAPAAPVPPKPRRRMQQLPLFPEIP